MARPRLYPVHLLEVGQSLFFPWFKDDQGRRLNRESLPAAVRQEQRRFGKRFLRRSDHWGIRVTRVV